MYVLERADPPYSKGGPSKGGPVQRKMAEQQRVNITTAQMFKNLVDTFYEKDDDDMALPS